MYNPLLHHRRSIRLKNYDYSKEGLYFITLCSTQSLNIFGHISNGEMNLNTFGEIAAEEWLASAIIRKNISLGEFIIMPNHMHGIISIDCKIENDNKENLGKFKSPSQSIGAIIRGYKGATTKRINLLIREEGNKIIAVRESDSGDSFIKDPVTGVLQYAPTKTSTNGPTRNRKEKGRMQFAPTDAPTEALTGLSGEGSIWQRNYYEIIIRTDRAYQNISNYIINNSKSWTEDKLKG